METGQLVLDIVLHGVHDPGASLRQGNEAFDELLERVLFSDVEMGAVRDTLNESFVLPPIEWPVHASLSKQFLDREPDDSWSTGVLFHGSHHERTILMKTVCPHCGYDSSVGTVATGAAKGAAVGVCLLINPYLGAAVLTGLALKAWLDSGKTEYQCPNCNKYYHD
jgi:predicted RNA-binding Zn-ribbon protein involved in translation (DUF1610 family)